MVFFFKLKNTMQIAEFKTKVNDGIVHIPEKYQNFNNKKVKLIIISEESDEDWNYWSDNEIDNFGKIAIGLSKHNYDNEDYSKW